MATTLGAGPIIPRAKALDATQILPFVPALNRPRWGNLTVVAGVTLFWTGVILKIFG
ncbi:MAG: hypothetical protein JOZ27_03955 [Caulobacteraceae bacterium]|nr:hypothetical protein [Caulobacteraceae bacterium]